jgi:hypothetical protein
MVALDGGVFAYGDAPFKGSMGGEHLNEPMIGIRATQDGMGYWTVATDGGIFSYTDDATTGAGFYGSMGGQHLNEPMIAIL